MKKSFKSIVDSYNKEFDHLISNKIIHTLLILIGFLAVFRWFYYIDHYSVNLLYMDQWRIYGLLFEESTWLEKFTFQHGPHRQGLGMFITSLVANLSGMDTKAEAYVIGSFSVLTGISLLMLKKRLIGSLSHIDVVIVLLCVSSGHHAVFTNTPNISHGVLPVFLVSLYGWVLTLKNQYTLITSIVVLNFLLVYTGFGLIMGLITPLLLAFFITKFLRSKNYSLVLTSAISLGLSLLTLYSFFTNYFRNPVQLPGNESSYSYLDYLLFVVSGLSGYFGEPNIILGILVFGITLFVLVKIATRFLRLESWETIVVVFALFTIGFYAASAYGRVPEFGISGGSASRYKPYLIPLFFGIYIYVIQLKNWKSVATSLFILVIIYSNFKTKDNENRMEFMSHDKRVWRDMYLNTHSIDSANSVATHKIHPFISNPDLKKKLDWLEERKLNFFH